MPDSTTIAAQRQIGRERLDSHSLRPDQDIEALLSDLLGITRAQLFSQSERKLTSQELECLERSLERIENDEPIAYVRGKEEFWSLTLAVTPNVLIPRPDTERLVEVALERLREIDDAHILELGTGSGAIALALAVERQNDTIVATDLSAEAIDVAKTNFTNLAESDSTIANVTFLVSDWYQQLDERQYDLIVSNPPYIAFDDTHIEPSVKQHEPSIALFADDEGMAAIRHLIANAHEHLKPSGTVMFEHGWQQRDRVQQCFGEHHFTDIKTHQDLAGRDRVTEARLSTPD